MLLETAQRSSMGEGQGLLCWGCQECLGMVTEVLNPGCEPEAPGSLGPTFEDNFIRGMGPQCVSGELRDD